MAQFVSYSGPGNTPIYYQPTPFAPEPSYSPLFGYGMWQKVNNVGQPGPAPKPQERSMVAEYYANQQPYQQYASGYNPNLNINSPLTNLYTPSVGSLLSAPSSMPSYSGNYGAGRFLNTGNLLGFNFTPAQTTSSPGQSPAI